MSVIFQAGIIVGVALTIAMVFCWWFFVHNARVVSPERRQEMDEALRKTGGDVCRVALTMSIMSLTPQMKRRRTCWFASIAVAGIVVMVLSVLASVQS